MSFGLKLTFFVAAFLCLAMSHGAASAEAPVLTIDRSQPNWATQPRLKVAYPYGYFGAQGGKTWSRHFGYYRRYTQWTQR